MCAFTLSRRTALGLCHYGAKLKPGMREVHGWRRRVGRVFRRPVSGGDWGLGWLVSSRRRADVTLRHDASAATGTAARNSLRAHLGRPPTTEHLPLAPPALTRNLPQQPRWQPSLGHAFSYQINIIHNFKTNSFVQINIMNYILPVEYISKEFLFLRVINTLWTQS